MSYLCLYSFSCRIFKHFRVCEEAEWAVETLKKIGKPVMASLCVGPDGDHNGTSIEECAVRLIKAGLWIEDMYNCSCLHRNQRF